MSDDEQGYAPASFLEPVEGSGSDRDIHPEDDISQGEQLCSMILWAGLVGRERERERESFTTEMAGWAVPRMQC